MFTDCIYNVIVRVVRTLNRSKNDAMLSLLLAISMVISQWILGATTSAGLIALKGLRWLSGVGLMVKQSFIPMDN